MGKGTDATRHTRSAVLPFYASSANPNSTADPWHWIIHKRIMYYRRAYVKRPHLTEKMKEIMQIHTSQGKPGAYQDDCDTRDSIPMPRGGGRQGRRMDVETQAAGASRAYGSERINPQRQNNNRI